MEQREEMGVALGQLQVEVTIRTQVQKTQVQERVGTEIKTKTNKKTRASSPTKKEKRRSEKKKGE